MNIFHKLRCFFACLCLIFTFYLQADCDPGVKAIAGGGVHALSLKSDGTVWAWGANYVGQLGDGSITSFSNVPVQTGGITPLTDVIAIEAGALHSLSLKSDGTVWAWGSNFIGQLGDGSTTDSPVPVQTGGITPLTDVIAIAGGDFHSLSLKSDGTVWAWGANNVGQLGNGTNTDSTVPVQVGGVTPLTDVIAIAGGNLHSLALKNDGTVWAWGFNNFGQLGNGTNTDSNVPVQVGGVTPLTDVIAIAAGALHSLSLKSDGTVWAWGANYLGQLGDGSTTSSNIPVQVGGVTPLTDVIAIGGGGEAYSLSLKSDGTVWAWGANNVGQLGNGTNTSSNIPVQVGGITPLTDVIAIAGSRYDALSLKSDGTVWAWGANNSGQLGNGTNTNSNVPVQTLNLTGIEGMKAIAGGGQHSLALKSEGTVWAWGLNSAGQLGNGTNTNSNVPVQVGGVTPLTDVMAIAAGNFHSLALKSDGTVWAWGFNNFGQLGNGTNTNSNVPVQVGGVTPLTDVIAIAGGNLHSLALKSDGTVWAWGANYLGQLGDGSTTSSNVPVQVGGVTPLTDVIAIAGGGSHSLALKSDGTVWAWGDNSFGQLGNGTNTNSTVPVQVGGVTPLTDVIALAAGSFHSLALKSDGTVWAWGLNNLGQLGNGSNTNSNVPVQVGVVPFTDVVAIAAGAVHSLALKSDGTAWAWGDNSAGELGNGSNTNSNVPVQVGVVPFTDVIALAGGGVHSLALKSDGAVWAWGLNSSGQLGDGTNTNSNVPVEVILIPVATAAPSSQTICSGGTTSIALSSNVPGTAFSWTVVQSGVSGASDGTGTSIDQILTTTTNSPGSVTYTITPTSPSGCIGSPLDVIVTVNPIPIVWATPSSQTICSGETTSIALSSNIPDTTFSWSAAQSGVSGASNGSGLSIIAQTLTATTNSPGAVTYTITPTGPSGCVGVPIAAVVIVNPIPVAVATPSSQTISSGETTSIALSSNIPDTMFSWSVVQSGVSGASDGAGLSIIAQTLTATTSASGVATYTITPLSPSGCLGAPITVVVTVTTQPILPPTHVKGCWKVDMFSPCVVNKITWQPPKSGAQPISYRIYRNASLTKLAGEVPANRKFEFKDSCKDSRQTCCYYVVSVDAQGNQSDAVCILIKKYCAPK